MAVDATNTRIDSGQQPNFKDSREASFRRVYRDVVRKSHLTRAEKDVTMAFLNHWFLHRHKGAVHPGKKKLAARSKASTPTVKRTLAMLREFCVIKAVAHETGNSAEGFGLATEYTLDTDALTKLCRTPKADLKWWREGQRGSKTGNIGGSKEPTSGGIKKNPRNNTALIIPFPKQGGGQ
jgi:hypothetical protein